MARISVDPTEDKNKPKFFNFRRKFNWPPYQAYGFLCAFWVSLLESEETESGDLTACTPEFIADRVGIGTVDPNELWEALLQGYVEARPNSRFIVQDWIEIAGPHLRQKYHNRENGRERLSFIWSLHGRIYGRETRTQKLTESGEESDQQSDDSHLTVSSIEAKNSGISEIPSTQSLKRHVSKRGEDLRGTPSSSPSWETDGKEEGAQGAFEIPISPPEEERRDKKSRPEVNLLQESFRKKFIEYNQGKPVSFSFGEWGKSIKQLLADEFTPQEIDKRFSFWLSSSHPFVQENRKNPRYFYQRFDDLEKGPLTANQERYGRKPFDDGEGNSPNYKYSEPVESDV